MTALQTLQLAGNFGSVVLDCPNLSKLSISSVIRNVAIPKFIVKSKKLSALDLPLISGFLFVDCPELITFQMSSKSNVGLGFDLASFISLHPVTSAKATL
jgi:hypothetical protein